MSRRNLLTLCDGKATCRHARPGPERACGTALPRPGNVFRALQTVEDLEFDLDVDGAGPEQRKLCKAVGEFGGYLRANAASIPNYGERYRAGEVISSSKRSPPSTR